MPVELHATSPDHGGVPLESVADFRWAAATFRTGRRRYGVENRHRRRRDLWLPPRPPTGQRDTERRSESGILGAGNRRLPQDRRPVARGSRTRIRADEPRDGQGGARPHALKGERRLTRPCGDDARSVCPATSATYGRARHILRISHAGNESCLSDSACQPVGTFLAKLTPRGLLIESTIGRAQLVAPAPIGALVG
jgi:hypothetical protein